MDVYLWCLTADLTPLGLSSSQADVWMLQSLLRKGDCLPVWRDSSRALFPCRGGPTTIIFSRRHGSAPRNSARRYAKTAEGPKIGGREMLSYINIYKTKHTFLYLQGTVLIQPVYPKVMYKKRKENYSCKQQLQGQPFKAQREMF